MPERYNREAIQLQLDLNRAKREGNRAAYQQIQARLAVIHADWWRTKVAYFGELAPYQTFVEALAATAQRLGLAFPDRTDPRHHGGDGYFIFGISDGERTVQIFPMEDRGYYDVELFDYDPAHTERCYKGHTTSLTAAATVLSRWYMERCAIESLHAQFPWLPQEPFRLDGPRMTFED